jgi:hypothetical protein
VVRCRGRVAHAARGRASAPCFRLHTPTRSRQAVASSRPVASNAAPPEEAMTPHEAAGS